MLHTWGSAMMHHPHVHMIVPGGGISPDGTRWIAASAKFLLPVRVLSALFRRRMIKALVIAHKAGKLKFFGKHADLADRTAFTDYLAPLKDKRWHVYAKPPFGGPKAVLAYLARYTHRVAISNRRLIKADAHGVTFKFKDYRIDGRGRYRTMTVHPHEFIRRFLIHVLPKGLHRIRHYGLLANGQREANLAKARQLLRVKTIDPADDGLRADEATPPDVPTALPRPCPCCGARMLIIETFEGVCWPATSPATGETESGHLMSAAHADPDILDHCCRWSCTRCDRACLDPPRMRRQIDQPPQSEVNPADEIGLGPRVVSPNLFEQCQQRRRSAPAAPTATIESP